MPEVFPARAGMSRRETGNGYLAVGVPRASGDEPPSNASNEILSRCSPRERG